MADLLETLANGVYEFGKNYIEDRNNGILARWEDGKVCEYDSKLLVTPVNAKVVIE